MKRILNALSIFASLGVCTAFAQIETGFVTNGTQGQQVNRAAIAKIQYYGECPGEEMIKPEVFFQSATWGTRPNQRVVIENTSGGFTGSTLPYADREYDEGSLSERTFLGFSTSHRGRFLAVREGENRFTYRIVDGNRRVVESGEFSTFISVVDLGFRERPKRCSWQSTCNEYGCFPVEVCYCP